MAIPSEPSYSNLPAQVPAFSETERTIAHKNLQTMGALTQKTKKNYPCLTITEERFEERQRSYTDLVWNPDLSRLIPLTDKTISIIKTEPFDANTLKEIEKAAEGLEKLKQIFKFSTATQETINEAMEHLQLAKEDLQKNKTGEQHPLADMGSRVSDLASSVKPLSSQQAQPSQPPKESRQGYISLIASYVYWGQAPTSKKTASSQEQAVLNKVKTFLGPNHVLDEEQITQAIKIVTEKAPSFPALLEQFLAKRAGERKYYKEKLDAEPYKILYTDNEYFAKHVIADKIQLDTLLAEINPPEEDKTTNEAIYTIRDLLSHINEFTGVPNTQFNADLLAYFKKPIEFNTNDPLKDFFGTPDWTFNRKDVVVAGGAVHRSTKNLCFQNLREIEALRHIDLDLDTYVKGPENLALLSQSLTYEEEDTVEDYYKYESLYQFHLDSIKAKLKLAEEKGVTIPQELRDYINNIEKIHGFVGVGLPYKSKASWEIKEASPDQLFKKGVRHLDFMDKKGDVRGITVDLDLSSLGKLTNSQLEEVFKFIRLLDSNLGRSKDTENFYIMQKLQSLMSEIPKLDEKKDRAEILKKTTLIKELISKFEQVPGRCDLPQESQQFLDNMPLTSEQKKSLLEIASKFSLELNRKISYFFINYGFLN